MEPHLGNNDKILFNQYLNKATIFFEYGSGGSTYQACNRENIQKIYSVESDIAWYNKVKQNIKNSKVTYYLNEMDTIPNNWGHPGNKATTEQKQNYSNYMMKLSKEEQQSIDLVFIDGRFRVACCLKCYNVIKDDCLIIFDDFLGRSYYHIVLDYFDIVDKTVDNRMVVLKKKQGLQIPQEIIDKYEMIAK